MPRHFHASASIQAAIRLQWRMRSLIRLRPVSRVGGARSSRYCELWQSFLRLLENGDYET